MNDIQTRPETVADQLLDAFAATLADIRREYAYQPGDEVLHLKLAMTRHRLRDREQVVAISRVVIRLHGFGIDAERPRAEPDGFFHTVDPLVSFSECSSCGGSVTYDPPCRFPVSV